MRSIEIPVWAPWGQAPELVALTSALRVDARPGLIALWSWSAVHPGAHPAGVWEAIADWRGTPGSLAAALVATGWATEADGLVSLVDWRDLLGGDADETPEERRRRQLREAARRYRQSQKAASSTVINASSDRHQSSSVHHQPIIIPSSTVINASSDRHQASSSVITKTDPLLISLKSEEEEEEPEAEEERHVPISPAAPGAGAAPLVVSSTADVTVSGDEEIQFWLDWPTAPPPSASTAPTADGRERPAVGPGSTNGAEVRSVPVHGSDRAPEGDSGRPALELLPGVPVEPAGVDVVWQAYVTATAPARVRLTAGRRALIARRLRDYSVDDLVRALQGYATSDWHRGANDRGRAYQSLELWLRDAAHIEAGWGYLDMTRKNLTTARRRSTSGPALFDGIEAEWAEKLAAAERGQQPGGVP